jgi:hypothetical protein
LIDALAAAPLPSLWNVHHFELRRLATTAMQQKLVTPVHSVKDAAVLAAVSSGVGSSRPNTRRGSKTRLAKME